MRSCEVAVRARVGRTKGIVKERKSAELQCEVGVYRTDESRGSCSTLSSTLGGRENFSGTETKYESSAVSM